MDTAYGTSGTWFCASPHLDDRVADYEREATGAYGVAVAKRMLTAGDSFAVPESSMMVAMAQGAYGMDAV
jgi:hypothetical protein